ncbi:hypothetical protein Q8A67_014068 [Cirrhinus molitorella]|uniref:Uncharacterized protein n=1 Tax=Cirrhinus molitorella TaxID=172907 RepID=A0AA88PT34_9TELE|nr:hypothetical protein Q8A67_014068 [Cirrhinus molitorella]
MAFIKEENEDVKIEDAIRVKQEDTEEPTELMVLKVENQELNETEEKHDFVTGEQTRRRRRKRRKRIPTSPGTTTPLVPTFNKSCFIEGIR